MKETAGKYPAPLAIIDVVEKGFEAGADAGYAAEASRFGQLGMTPESRALVSIFQGQTALKKNRFSDASDASSTTSKVNTVAVVGAGLMGAGIAQVSIQVRINALDFECTSQPHTQSGLTVLLKDMTQAGLDRGVQQV